jgi:hypothetical protein
LAVLIWRFEKVVLQFYFKNNRREDKPQAWAFEKVRRK